MIKKKDRKLTEFPLDIRVCSFNDAVNFDLLILNGVDIAGNLHYDLC